jgi:predicted RNase H-like HicB family nuclease
MTRDEYLRIPFVLVLESVVKPDGDWCRRASYPELPGACAEAESAVDAMDAADRRRVAIILESLRSGTPIPVPRQPI